MKSILLAVLTVGCINAFNQANAHPVAFKDSKGFMGYHSPSLTHTQFNYSGNYWWAVGAHYYKRSNLTKNDKAQFISGNILFKRWNGKALQANLYGILGAGQSNFSGESKGALLTGLQYDIEDRDYYLLLKHQAIRNKDNKEYQHSSVRLGFTPYVGDFEDIHSWIIFEWTSTQFNSESVQKELTPMLRFFYKNLLFEIGQSFDGNTKFNYITHF